jgi:hypothetical protein
MFATRKQTNGFRLQTFRLTGRNVPVGSEADMPACYANDKLRRPG